MNGVPTTDLRAGQSDRGFTLIELVIALTLSLLIAGVVVAGLVTSLNVSSATSAQVSDSTDAGLITSFLTRDAQSAGAIDPTTAARDATVGVSTGSTPPPGWSDCPQPGTTLVVRFSWVERPTALTKSKVVVTYGFGTKQLTRRLCRETATPVDVVLGRDLESVSAICDTTCTTAPTTVSLLVTAAGTRAPLSYTLKATLRGDTQAAPDVGNSMQVPLLALGAGATVTCPNLELAGTGAITVRGNALVDSLCGAVPIKDNSLLLKPTGTTSTVAGIVDPFVGRVPPTSSACASGGTNPVIFGLSASASTVVVYPQAVNLSLDTAFQPGRYVFCKGLLLTSGRITGTNVLLYIATGTFEAQAAATVDLSGNSTVDANMLVWVASSGQTVKIAAGAKVSSYRGLVYAPTSRMELSSTLGGNIGGINAQGLKVTGAGQARLGLPVPPIAITPASLPAAQANVAYSAALAVTGGTAPYTWSAAGLPAVLTIDANTGVISGTPTAAGTPGFTVTVIDSTNAAASIDYTLTVKTALSINSAPTLPNGQVGVVYATTTLTPVGGTAPYVWTVDSGLPPGLTLSSTGTMSGTPTSAGTFPVVIRVTDAVTTATKTYNVVINGTVAIVGPALPNGKISVAYATTTITATGGTLPYTWSQTGLPAGLTLDQATGTVSGKPTVSGTFSVVVTVTDAVGATAQATYPVTITSGVTECPATTTPWTGEYYANSTLNRSPKFTRDDADINFNWGSNGPGGGIGKDNFSVRWTRTSNFAAGNYTFTLSTDDGSRMYIDNVLIAPLNHWAGPQTISYTQFMTGWHTIKVEYVEASGSAWASLVTTFASVTQVASNGVTAVPKVADNQPYFGELNIKLSNPSDVITAMSATFTVAQTPDVTYHGQYTDLPNSDIYNGHVTCTGLVAYNFTLTQGLTIRTPGSWVLAAQWDGRGTPRVTSGDTWSVTTMTSKGLTTTTGTFP